MLELRKLEDPLLCTVFQASVILHQLEKLLGLQSLADPQNTSEQDHTEVSLSISITCCESFPSPLSFVCQQQTATHF